MTCLKVVSSVGTQTRKHSARSRYINNDGEYNNIVGDHGRRKAPITGTPGARDESWRMNIYLQAGNILTE